MKHRIILILCRISLTLNFTTGIYLLILATSKREKNGNASSKEDTPKSHSWLSKHIIVLDKTGLLEDLKLISSKDSNFPTLFVVPRFLVSKIAEHFLPARQRADFLPRNEYDAFAHEKLKILWKKVLPRLTKKLGSRILISANYTYGNERDLQEVASSLGIKVTIIYKECFMSEGDEENLIRLFKESRPFTGAKLLVYNKMEIKRQLKSGNATENQVAVVGSPRFDSLILQDEKRISKNQSKIVFFVHDYVPPEDTWSMNKSQIEFLKVYNNQIDFGLKLICAAAEEYPELKFELKTKITLASVNYVQEKLKGTKLPSNLKTYFGGGLASLSLENCIAAIGFNTTALVDAKASGCHIGVLRFEIPDNYLKKYVIQYDEARELRYVGDFTQWIAELINQFQEGSIHLSLTEEGRNFLEFAVGNPDGKSSFRALEELKLIDSESN